MVESRHTHKSFCQNTIDRIKDELQQEGHRGCCGGKSQKCKDRRKKEKVANVLVELENARRCVEDRLQQIQEICEG